MQAGRLDEQGEVQDRRRRAASRMSPDVAEKVQTLAGSLYPDRTPEIFFHPQCFATHGHFAGDDEMRAQSFLDIANAPLNHQSLQSSRETPSFCREHHRAVNTKTSLRPRRAMTR